MKTIGFTYCRDIEAARSYAASMARIGVVEMYPCGYVPRDFYPGNMPFMVSFYN